MRDRDHEPTDGCPSDDAWPTEEQERSLDRAHRSTRRAVAAGRARELSDAELARACRESAEWRRRMIEAERREGHAPAKGA